ncbi:exodeoxyribonuclease V subunit alpha [Thaumasiovibrio sp. DFM-14]|uniref:exodeoxyribonuclease V subunit alpha n=1 Tax=Thaumasiovibrio sp. DFM-14 TaxID=3384792 RepID=UPI0039A18CFA
MKTLLIKLSELMDRGTLRAIDYQLARYISLQSGASSTVVLWAAQLSYRAGQGHTCISLAQSQHWFELSTQDRLWLLEGVVLDEPLTAMAACIAIGHGSDPTPLVIEDNRLYLARFWRDEQVITHYLASKLTPQPLDEQHVQRLGRLFERRYLFLSDKLSHCATTQARRQVLIDVLDVVSPQTLPWEEIDKVLAADGRVETLQQLDQLVPTSACLNWQKVAAAVALSRRFSVISGGPGTGKTTTVIRLLAALIDDEVPPLIKLVAPTGKAAARLTESIGGALASLPVSPELKNHIPTDATTIHRLLGAIPHRAGFRHHSQNPLHLDVLVVDEASMVDLSMMARLLEALPPHARLVLLGDKDQLASVEAGSVLGDICQLAELGYSPEQAQALSMLTGYSLPASGRSQPLADGLCMLRKSHRFHAQSGIGQLASAVNAGNVAQVEQVWAQHYSDIARYELSAENYAGLIQRLITEYRRYFVAAKEGQSAPAVLKYYNQVRLLCALREGDTGVEGMNQRIERALRQQGLIGARDETWYVGRPVMISRNDFALGLSNGDIGITLFDAEQQRLRVYFELPDGTIKGFLPSRIPTHETAYAMTIHKSQGSEFDNVYLLLPAKPSPIVTRELIYTGITRSKKALTLYASSEVMRQGVSQRIYRFSGLKKYGSN